MGLRSLILILSSITAISCLTLPSPMRVQVVMDGMATQRNTVGPIGPCAAALENMALKQLDGLAMQRTRSDRLGHAQLNLRIMHRSWSFCGIVSNIDTDN